MGEGSPVAKILPFLITDGGKLACVTGRLVRRRGIRFLGEKATNSISGTILNEFKRKVWVKKKNRERTGVAEGRVKDVNLLLAKCEVRRASYGPSFFPSFLMAQARSAREGVEKQGSIICSYGQSKRS